MRTSFISLLILLGLISCSTKNPVPNDALMTEYFNHSKESLEKLVSYFIEDSLKYFPLFYQDVRDGDTLMISKERELEYIKLMDSLSIKRIGRYNNLSNVESVILYYFGKGGIGWSVDKGYEYVITPDVEFIYEKGELWDEARKSDFIVLRKKLDDNWNLYLMYSK